MSDTRTDRGTQRQEITQHLLTALEQVVWRGRAMHDSDLYAEVVTAEVAHQLAVARTALRRYPPIGA